GPEVPTAPPSLEAPSTPAAAAPPVAPATPVAPAIPAAPQAPLPSEELLASLASQAPPAAGPEARYVSPLSRFGSLTKPQRIRLLALLAVVVIAGAFYLIQGGSSK